MPNLTETIHQHLDSLGVSYLKLRHPAVTTSAAAAKARGVELHSGAKALLVKANDEYTVFVIPGDMRLDWKAAKRAVGCKSARFATPEEMLDRTGLVKGSLPPFGNLLGLRVFMDDEVHQQLLVRFNAASLVDSIELAGTDLVRAAAATSGTYAMW